jgi:hypothetical protein
MKGFWNFFAYVRPRFNIVSAQHEGKGIMHRLYITIFTKPGENQSSSSRRRGQSNLTISSRRPPKQKEIKASGNSNKEIVELKFPSNPTQSSALQKKLFDPEEQIQVTSEAHNVEIVSTAIKEDPSETRINGSEGGFENDTHLKCDSSTNMVKQEYDEQYDQDIYDVEDLQHVKHLDRERNYRIAETLTLLVAEDILPRSNNPYWQGRRMSMNDISFPIDWLGKAQMGAYALSSSFEVIDEGENLEHPCGIETNEDIEVIIPPLYSKRNRRHSCPNMTFDIAKLDKM